MLTYSFENRGNESLYEFLYKKIKNDILSATLKSGEKLPSKRALAKHLNVSTITVENSYNQLMAEGYLYSVPKSGFYVSDISSIKPLEKGKPLRSPEEIIQTPGFFADFTNNSTLPETFPWPFRGGSQIVLPSMT